MITSMDFDKNHSTVHPVVHLLNDVAETNNKSTKAITLSISQFLLLNGFKI